MSDVRVLASALSTRRPAGVRAYGVLAPASRGLDLPLPGGMLF